MKKSFALLLLSVLFVSSSAMAQEAAPQALPASLMEKGVYTMVVKADGQQEVRPGKLFSEGLQEGVALPYLVAQPKAIEYPRWAVRQGWQGKFVIAIEVLTDGSVGRTSIMHSTGYRILDKAAAEAIQTWKFQPAVREGRAVVECIQVPVVFELQEA